jgi:hypothetical protein
MLDNEKKNIKFVCVGDRRVSVENTNKTIAGFSHIRWRAGLTAGQACMSSGVAFWGSEIASIKPMANGVNTRE